MIHPIPTDVELLEVAGQAYLADAAPFFFDEMMGVKVVFRRTAAGCAIMGFRGTQTAWGWVTDFTVWMAADQRGVEHQTLGLVHEGFYRAALICLGKILDVADKEQVALAGHSLGAALALLVGGLLTDHQTPPVRVGAFAPPRVGTKQFIDLAAGIPTCAYRYGRDPVTEVPFTLRGLSFEQVPLTHLRPPRLLPKVWWPGDHRFENYDSAVRALAQSKESRIAPACPSSTS